MLASSAALRRTRSKGESAPGVRAGWTVLHASVPQLLRSLRYSRREARKLASPVHPGEVKLNTALSAMGDWDFLYANALLEPDANRLRERIASAEAAINERLNALVESPPDNPEKAALIDALRTLHVLPARRSRAANPISFGTET